MRRDRNTTRRTLRGRLPIVTEPAKDVAAHVCVGRSSSTDRLGMSDGSLA